MKRICPLMSTGEWTPYSDAGEPGGGIDCDPRCGFFDAVYERCSLVSIAASLRDIEVRVEEAGIR